MGRWIVGKLVYTINATTNLVDVWRCTDVMRGRNGETMYELRDGQKIALLPSRCVYYTEAKAKAVINKKL